MSDIETPIYHLEKVVRAKADDMEDFNGPLDLILSLLAKNKMEIQDIQISLILDQYMAWIEKRRAMDLEVASEFITMASQLMFIKSRMLLSIHDEEAISELDQLIASLEERERRESFIRLQEVLPQLEAQSGRDSFTKGPEAKFLQRVYRYEHKKEDLTAAVLAWQARKEADRPPDGRLLRRTVRPEPYRVEEKLRQLLEDLEQEGETTLTSLVKRSESRSEVTAVFLALLQLCREGRVHVAGTMEDPAISLRPGEDEKEGGGADGGS